MNPSGSIHQNLRTIQGEIEDAAARVGRNPAEVTMIAVSKTVSIDRVREAYDFGIRDFGESRWQELETKAAALPNDIRWHFIGTLQSNKAKKVASLCSSIHTLDSEAQLREISKQSQVVDGYIEMNLAKESQKSGIFVTTLDDFIRQVIQCNQVKLRGLMTIGPVDATVEEKRRLFRELAVLAHERGLEQTSMGMSDDFGLAIQEGATQVRIGSRIFGLR